MPLPFELNCQVLLTAISQTIGEINGTDRAVAQGAGDFGEGFGQGIGCGHGGGYRLLHCRWRSRLPGDLCHLVKTGHQHGVLFCIPVQVDAMSWRPMPNALKTDIVRFKEPGHGLRFNREIKSLDPLFNNFPDGDTD